VGSVENRDLDRLARDLAAGGVSRRSALRRLLGLSLGILAPAALADNARAEGGCTNGRVKCDGKCCPKNAKCKKGKCKCKKGYEKCGKKCCSVCAPSEAFCSGECVDLDVDEANCGDCGIECGPGAACQDGKCLPECAAGETDCSGVCVDLTNDANNCGQCDLQCPGGEICQDSICTT
jgi:hypothetical protein